MSERKWMLVCLLVTSLSWMVITDSLLPGATGRIGHDYAYFLPRLLAGEYWIENNGWFSLPWFSPAFGAGLPAYAHPANGHVSLPQWLCAFVDPLTAVRWTALISLIAGFVGMWLFARRSLKLGAGAAALASVLFALNGFHIARMAVGHLAFHASMLAPLCAWLLLRPASTRAGWWAGALGAGLCLSYQLQAGNVYGLPPLLLALAALTCVHVLRGGTIRSLTGRAAVALLVMLGLCAAKLCAALAFLSSFPRSGYPLPGAESPLALLELLFRALFFSPPADKARELFVNQPFLLGEHEWDLGLTLVPLVAILLGAALCFRAETLRSLARQRWALATLLLICVVPLALNLHSPGWERVLKSLPVVGSSSSFVRWLWMFVPLVAVLAACAIEGLERRAWLARASWVAMAVFLALQVMHSRKVYAEQPYDPRPVVDAWKRHAAPTITRVTIPAVVDGQIRLSADRDDALLRGESQLLTYEPLFGYRLEWFPKGPVRPGEVRIGNLHHPLAFLYPEAAGRAPGAPFQPGEEAQLQAFVEYRSFEIEWPLRQRVANLVNLLALAGVSLLAAALLYSSLRRQRSSPGS